MNTSPPIQQLTGTPYVAPNHTGQLTYVSLPPTQKPPEGVWFVHGWDNNAYPVAVFGDTESLAKWLDQNGTNGWDVTWWPFGVRFDERKKATS